MNSFTVNTAEELEAFFLAAEDDDTIRAIIVTGEGKAFCVGMDLTEEGNVFGLDESGSAHPPSPAEPLSCRTSSGTRVDSWALNQTPSVSSVAIYRNRLSISRDMT